LQGDGRVCHVIWEPHSKNCGVDCGTPWTGSATGHRIRGAGRAVGGHASAAVLTSTVKLKGKVITIDGSRFVSTPAITVKVKGKVVHIPARTVKLPAHTVVKGKTVPVKVDVNRTVKVPVTDIQTKTVNHTVTTVRTTIQTVTGPTTTVNGPTTTITLPASTVTVTVPT
jgi:hypothetical protein